MFASMREGQLREAEYENKILITFDRNKVIKDSDISDSYSRNRRKRTIKEREIR